MIFPLRLLISLVVKAVLRGSQFAVDLLVVGITWWYSYQSYRIREGIKLGETLSSVLIYNGEWFHGYNLVVSSYTLSIHRKYIFPVGLTFEGYAILEAHCKILRILAVMYIADIIYNVAPVRHCTKNGTLSSVPLIPRSSRRAQV